ncbi:MAG TPA: hypothetical protein VFS63_13365 [Pseudolabrys sp.]|jgi:hypothetical protein|nr:hypothetical protein [Pseudolabrys sp.]
MTLFLPSARATNWLLAIGFTSLGYALYLRYMGIEQSGVGLACAAGLDTWLCLSRRVVIALYMHSVFGGTALAVAVLNLLRPSLILFAVGLAVSALGVVLYNAGLSGLAVGVLILSLARPAPEPE